MEVGTNGKNGMTARRLNAHLGVLLACTSLIGCNGSEWQKVQIDSPYQVPKALTITVIAPSEVQQAARALTSALVAELKSGGIAATVVPESAESSEAELVITKWDPGSPGVR